MYECKNCGGNVKFDIASQQLRCEHCDSLFNPYDVVKDKDAEENDYFQTTIFTCPQCGSEIMADENSAAEFCLYCGGSTVLSSRISSEKKPKYIIPFKVTKEDCIKAYKKKMKTALFAPKELKEPEYIKKFKGIYMPYWIYDVKQEGMVTLKGEKVKQQGKYEITEKYNLKYELQADYDGISHDASSYFKDDTTERMAPYQAEEMVMFTPSMLSGFYADTADVNAQVYTEDCEKFANEVSYKRVKSCKEFKSYKITKPSEKKMSETFHTNTELVGRSFNPVWFLTYRNKERVLYATVNGQTGKVVADIPVDFKKYLLGSLLLAVPIFVLLNLFCIMIPAAVMSWAAVFSLITTIIYGTQLKKLTDWENGLDDKGYIDVNGKKRRNRSSKKNTSSKVSLVISIVICIILGLFAIKRASITPVMLVPVAVLIIDLIFAAINEDKIYLTTKLIYTKGFLAPLITVFLSAVMIAINPPNDLWFYGITVLCAGANFISIFEIIQKYNMLSTHAIPSLHNRGGEQNA